MLLIGLALRALDWVNSTGRPRRASHPHVFAAQGCQGPLHRRARARGRGPRGLSGRCLRRRRRPAARKSSRCCGFTSSIPPACPRPAAPEPDLRRSARSRPASSSRMRYRMVTRLGRGGMGDVWRADDLMLETPVALKLIRSTSQAGRERLLQEVRLARRVTHPAVVRVFDVGEADDEVFFSMELVEGQDLASLLRHAGRLAPGAGDRDRPAALRRPARGARRGRAAPRPEAGQRPGRPARSRAHHRLRHRRADGRAGRTHACRHAELHGARAADARRRASRRRRTSTRWASCSTSCCTGQHPTGVGPGDGAIVPPSSSRRASTRRSRTSSCARCRRRPRIGRRRRPPSPPCCRPANRKCTRCAASSPRPPRCPSGRARGGWAIAGVLVLLVALGAACSRRWPAAPSAPLTSLDTIVLADFVNTTSEPLFDGALKVALAVALEQSPFLKVFPDDRVQETLRLMERPPDERDHARGRARNRGARAPQGDHFGVDRQPGPQLRAGARSRQRADRRRDGARAGRGRAARKRC